MDVHTHGGAVRPCRELDLRFFVEDSTGEPKNDAVPDTTT